MVLRGDKTLTHLSNHSVDWITDSSFDIDIFFLLHPSLFCELSEHLNFVLSTYYRRFEHGIWHTTTVWFIIDLLRLVWQTNDKNQCQYFLFIMTESFLYIKINKNIYLHLRNVTELSTYSFLMSLFQTFNTLIISNETTTPLYNHIKPSGWFLFFFCIFSLRRFEVLENFFKFMTL